MKNFPSITAIVLAAGLSTRFGVDNKLLATVDGRPIIERVLSSVVAAGFENRLIVTSGDAPEIQQIAEEKKFKVVVNQQSHLGIGTSLAKGVSDPSLLESDGIAVFLGDLPHLDSHSVKKVVTDLRIQQMSP